MTTVSGSGADPLNGQITIAAPSASATGALGAFNNANALTLIASGALVVNAPITTMGGNYATANGLLQNLTLQSGLGHVLNYVDTDINSQISVNGTLTLSSYGNINISAGLTAGTFSATSGTGGGGGGGGLGNIHLFSAGSPSIQTTGGGQAYNGPVFLFANPTLNDNNSGNITFYSTVDADSAGNNRTLTVETKGTTAFYDKVGGGHALYSLTVDDLVADAGGPITLGNAGTDPTMLVQTEGGGQTYGSGGNGNAVTLGANTTLNDSSSGNITFYSTVDGTTAGAQALTVETSGTTAFIDKVGGSQALSGLTVDDLVADAGGPITLGSQGTDAAMLVQTKGGGQQYGSSGNFNTVTLGANTILNDSSGGNITFYSTVNGDFPGNNRTLTVDTGGTTTFSSTVGGTTPLGSLTADGAGSVAINTASVTTTTDQDYAEPVSLGAATVTMNSGPLNWPE